MMVLLVLLFIAVFFHDGAIVVLLFIAVFYHDGASCVVVHSGVLS